MGKIVLLTIVFLYSLFSFSQDTTFTLKSKDLGGQFTAKQVFNKFGCKGKNISPELSWEHAPAGTESFAVTIFDPDAPTGSGWWHWLIFNIPNSINELPENAGNPDLHLLPESVIQSINDFGNYGYGGPCPPAGDKPHRYIITVYALKIQKIDLSRETNPATVGFYINNHTLAKASMLVYYGR